MQKIIIERNEDTKCCDVMDITDKNKELFPTKEIADCEQDWRGWWYKTEDVPVKPQELLEEEIKSYRNTELQNTDKFMIEDYPITEEEKALYKKYRTYLRDYTLLDKWWLKKPLSFDDWKLLN